MRAAKPAFRVVRSVSGSQGSDQGGVFIVTDPRTVFYVPQDSKVIVYFEWEGPLGLHQFEGLWKNPEGKVVVISDFEYEAREKRFAGYWVLNLTDGVKPGVWTLEARVDGEVAGEHTFQVVAATRPDPSGPARRVLAPSEIYQRALAATVSIEKISTGGKRLAQGSGFFLDADLIVTAFQVIDGASSLRVQLGGGQRLEVNQVVAWDRWQDWAILKTQPEGARTLERAESDSWAVGDRCFSLDATAEGNRTIVDGNIVGEHDFPRAGARLNLGLSVRSAAIGSPLLNEYGEVVGVVTRGGLFPGAGSLSVVETGYPANVLDASTFFRQMLAVPIELVPTRPADEDLVELSELKRAGQFIPPLVGHRNVARGTMARQVKRNRGAPLLVDERFEFTAQDGEIVVFLVWEPREKLASKVSIQVYDLDNRILAQSKPKKLKLKPGRVLDTSWKVDIANLRPGIYRVDVVLDPDPAWRSFFRIVD